MANEYSFHDWEADFYFLTRYVYPSESGYFPPDYEREIEAHYIEHYSPGTAAFRYERASSMLRFLVANIASFEVGGLAMQQMEEEVLISKPLWIALWQTFGMPDKEKFDPNPDPQKIVADAEDIAAIFSPEDESGL